MINLICFHICFNWKTTRWSRLYILLFPVCVFIYIELLHLWLRFEAYIMKYTVKVKVFKRFVVSFLWSFRCLFHSNIVFSITDIKIYKLFLYFSDNFIQQKSSSRRFNCIDIGNISENIGNIIKEIEYKMQKVIIRLIIQYRQFLVIFIKS